MLNLAPALVLLSQMNNTVQHTVDAHQVKGVLAYARVLQGRGKGKWVRERMRERVVELTGVPSSSRTAGPWSSIPPQA